MEPLSKQEQQTSQNSDDEQWVDIDLQKILEEEESMSLKPDEKLEEDLSLESVGQSLKVINLVRASQLKNIVKQPRY